AARTSHFFFFAFSWVECSILRNLTTYSRLLYAFNDFAGLRLPEYCRSGEMAFATIFFLPQIESRSIVGGSRACGGNLEQGYVCLAEGCACETSDRSAASAAAATARRRAFAGHF